jgi:hypothetical protein
MQMMGFKFVSAKNEQNNQWLEIGCSSLTQLKLRKEGIRNFPYTGHDICRNCGDGLQFEADEFIARDSRTSSGRFLTRELFHHTRAMNFHGAGADVEHAGDGLVGIADDQPLENLALAPGQARQGFARQERRSAAE